MSIINDLVGGVVDSVLKEILKKTTGTRKRARRRKGALTATERLEKIEKLLKPARKQISRKRSVSARSKARRRAG
jgi:hypothetical protein